MNKWGQEFYRVPDVNGDAHDLQNKVFLMLRWDFPILGSLVLLWILIMPK